MSIESQAPTFAWVERAAQRRAERQAEPPADVVPPAPVGPICGHLTVLWPDAECIDVTCQRPAGHDADTDDDHIEHEDGGLTWCTPIDRPAKEVAVVTADEVRAIAREEIQAAFKALAEGASGFPGYETDTIEDGAARMLQRVAEGTADALRHAQ
ncbi:hypothetical protein [Streptomyces sp. or20]|uniref:hypothetical protein n=1 Tax=Streptomyces sp. or20 TaxID=1828016 RepID=UPI000BF1DF74|nr:hypothetical protein [Streptomyces sp. or20]